MIFPEVVIADICDIEKLANKYNFEADATFRCGIFWQIMQYRIRPKKHIMRPGAVNILQNVRPLCDDFMQIVRLLCERCYGFLGC